MNIVYIQLGSNLGDRAVMISNAVNLILENIGDVFKCSKVYETTAWGVDGQPNYLNQVIGVKTILSADNILKQIIVSQL